MFFATENWNFMEKTLVAELLIVKNLEFAFLNISPSQAERNAETERNRTVPFRMKPPVLDMVCLKAKRGGLPIFSFIKFKK